MPLALHAVPGEVSMLHNQSDPQLVVFAVLVGKWVPAGVQKEGLAQNASGVWLL